MNFSLSRRIMIVLTVATVALGGIALPAAAKGGKGQGKRPAAETTETATPRAKGRSAEAKARKAGLRFVAVGYVTAVGTDTVQVDVKGGNKALRRMDVPVDFTVAEGAKVKRDGERVTLDVLQVGDHVMVKGAKIEDVLTARKVIASSPEVDETEDTTVDDGAGTVDDGTGTVDDGTGTVDDGTGTVDDGTGTVDDGTGTVDDGTGTVDDGTGTVDDGTTV